MINHQDLSLLHRYWANKLTPTEKELLKQHFISDINFLEDAFAEKIIYQALQQINEQQSVAAIKQAQQWTADLGDDLFAPNELEQLVQAETADWETIQTAAQASYTLDEILAMFAPCDELEEIVTRSGQGIAAAQQHPQVLQPQHQLQIKTTDQLVFKLQQGVPVPLTLLVYNNQTDELAAIDLPPNTATFTVAISHYPPGRYYWRLRANISGKERMTYATVMRAFLVGDAPK